MYVAAHFALDDAAIGSILAGMGSGDLVTAHAGSLDATYLPFEFVASPDAPLGSLQGHVARNNTQWREPCVGESMVIVHAGDHYVSPTWLPSTTEHGQIVPTWDYITVQAYGRLVAHDDRDWTYDVVRRLSERHEAALAAGGHAGPGASGERPWSLADAPAEYVERMMRAIVGVELIIDRWVGKAKMSQNKAPQDVEGEIAALRALGRDQLARFKTDVSLPAALARKELLADVARKHGSPARRPQGPEDV